MSEMLVLTFFSATVRELLFSFCKLGNKQKIFTWRGIQNYYDAFNTTHKEIRITFQLQNNQVNQTMEASIYERLRLPQTT